LGAGLEDKNNSEGIRPGQVPALESPQHSIAANYLFPVRNIQFAVTFSPRTQYDIPSSSDEFRKQPHSLSEKVLISALIERIVRTSSQGRAKAIAYELEDGVRKHQNLSFTEHESRQIKEIYKENPKKILKTLYDNLVAVASDPRASEPERKEMLSRYYDAAVKLTILLDDYVFPPHKPTDEPWKGVPHYLPDGFECMAGDIKVRVDKSIDLAKAKGIICSTIWEIVQKELNLSHEDAKRLIIDNVSNWLNENFNKPGLAGDKKLQNDAEISRLGAVIFQQFGITTRFFVTNVTYTDRHLIHRAVNLIRAKGQWFLLDIANPSDEFIYMKPLSNRDRFAKVPQLYLPINFSDSTERSQRTYKNDQTSRYKIVARDA